MASICSMSQSMETLSSSTTQLIRSFLVPLASGTSFEAPHDNPSHVTLRTAFSNFFISISPFQHFTSKKTLDAVYAAKRSPCMFAAADDTELPENSNESTRFVKSMITFFSLLVTARKAQFWDSTLARR